MRLKLCDSHLTSKNGNKYLNVRERVEVIEWSKNLSLPFLCCPVSRQCPLKEALIEKKIKKKKKSPYTFRHNSAFTTDIYFG